MIAVHERALREGHLAAGEHGQLSVPVGGQEEGRGEALVGVHHAVQRRTEPPIRPPAHDPSSRPQRLTDVCLSQPAHLEAAMLTPRERPETQTSRSTTVSP